MPELKRELQRRKLNAVGTRKELTERLLDDDRTQKDSLEELFDVGSNGTFFFDVKKRMELEDN